MDALEQAARLYPVEADPDVLERMIGNQYAPDEAGEIDAQQYDEILSAPAATLWHLVPYEWDTRMGMVLPSLALTVAIIRSNSNVDRWHGDYAQRHIARVTNEPAERWAMMLGIVEWAILMVEDRDERAATEAQRIEARKAFFRMQGALAHLRLLRRSIGGRYRDPVNLDALGAQQLQAFEWILTEVIGAITDMDPPGAEFGIVEGPEPVYGGYPSRHYGYRLSADLGRWG